MTLHGPRNTWRSMSMIEVWKHVFHKQYSCYHKFPYPGSSKLFIWKYQCCLLLKLTSHFHKIKELVLHIIWIMHVCKPHQPMDCKTVCIVKIPMFTYSPFFIYFLKKKKVNAAKVTTLLQWSVAPNTNITNCLPPILNVVVAPRPSAKIMKDIVI